MNISVPHPPQSVRDSTLDKKLRVQFLNFPLMSRPTVLYTTEECRSAGGRLTDLSVEIDPSYPTTRRDRLLGISDRIRLFPVSGHNFIQYSN
ncbi:hypothetical protein J6590_093139 [Homalodisca vitripennis]|nr:hypothetical protein J6590_093139 [Homalodisca vitripennis]